MPLTRGARLGPYEISGLLGAGGMGEVYRAHDTRLGRAVAVKVIPEELSAHKDRLRRFEEEARATAALSHPNILALYDVGVEGDVHYVVEELLEGETLRERLRRERLPVHEAAECGVQIARGLAAAHERGIVHRDLKPDERVPDSGRAGEGPGLRSREAAGDGARGGGGADGDGGDGRGDASGDGGLHVARAGEGGRRGRAERHLLAGRRPLRDAGGAAGIREAECRRDAERDPERRPGGAVGGGDDDPGGSRPSGPAVSGEAAAGPIPVGARRGAGAGGGVGAGERARGGSDEATAALAAMGHSRRPRGCHRRRDRGRLPGRASLERKPTPSYRQLTFRRGIVDRARFAPDGQTVVYSARWDGKPSEVFTARLDLAEAQALSLAQSARLDALHGGEALIHYEDGRLARMPLVGGTPRDVAENVVDSDWGPTGDIAVIRSSALWRRLASGSSTRSAGSCSSLPSRGLRGVRVSPQGDRVALVEGETGAFGGDVVVVDTSGRRTVLSAGWMEVDGLAWSPDGREVWFTAGGPARSGVGSWGTLKELRAVSLAGRERLLLRMAGDLTLQDVFRDGRVLVSHGRTRGEARGKLAGDEEERDLTYLDGTFTVGISADGRAVLFQECAQAGGPLNTAYLRRVGDPGPIRLGEGTAVALSPDGRRAIAMRGQAYRSDSRLVVLSAGAEPPLELPRGTLDRVGWAYWTPDGQRVMFQGGEKDRAGRGVHPAAAGRPAAADLPEENPACRLRGTDGRRARICRRTTGAPSASGSFAPLPATRRGQHRG